MKSVTRATAAGIAAVMLVPAGFAAASAVSLPAEDGKTVAIAKKKKKSINKTIVDNETFRQETVNGVTYTAAGGHTFKVRISKSGNVQYRKGYSARLTATANPEASSELTLNELVVPKKPLKVWDKNEKVEIVKGGRKVTEKINNLYVRSAFSGWVTTKFGTQYVQEGTLTTRVNMYGTSSAVKLSPEQKVEPVA